MSDWKNEDDIKAELRVLTGELKHLREELRGMVSPPKPNPSRAFLHRQSWPASSPKGGAPAPPKVEAADTPRPPRKKRR
jgi:hypothetical protein